jgi:hypothetical protein
MYVCYGASNRGKTSILKYLLGILEGGELEFSKCGTYLIGKTASGEDVASHNFHYWYKDEADLKSATGLGMNQCKLKNFLSAEQQTIGVKYSATLIKEKKPLFLFTNYRPEEWNLFKVDSDPSKGLEPSIGTRLCYDDIELQSFNEKTQ